MAGDKQDNVWPLPKFFFKVELGSDVMQCQEVTGLSIETTPIEYRHGDSPSHSTIKMPGIKKYGNVTLKRGIFAKDNKFWDWFNKIKLNTIERMTIKISLLDEAGGPTMVWTLSSAFPAKISGMDLKADGNEVAVQSVEIAHEGLTVENK